MTGVPAFVLGRRMDVLVWSALGDAVSGFSARPDVRPRSEANPNAAPNQARHVFLDPARHRARPPGPRASPEATRPGPS
jgi:hypothetical protein